MSKQFYDKIKPLKCKRYLKCTVNMYTKQFLTAATYPQPLGSLFDFTVFTYEVTVRNLDYFILNFAVVWYMLKQWTTQSLMSHFTYIQQWIPLCEWGKLSNRLGGLFLVSAGNV